MEAPDAKMKFGNFEETVYTHRELAAVVRCLKNYTDIRGMRFDQMYMANITVRGRGDIVNSLLTDDQQYMKHWVVKQFRIPLAWHLLKLQTQAPTKVHLTNTEE